MSKNTKAIIFFNVLVSLLGHYFKDTVLEASSEL